MTDKKVGICVCARLDSNRLPGKVLRKIGGKTTLKILLEHVIQHNHYPVVLAMPANEKDNPIENMVLRENIPVEIYRGFDDSPTHRINHVAKIMGWDYVVRITADDILIDQRILKRQIEWTINNGLDYSYVTRCVEGTAGEVIKTTALEEVVNKLNGANCEFLSYLLKDEQFKYSEYFPENEYQKRYRLTIDYPEDLQLLRIIDANLAKGYNTLDIINFLGKNPSLLQINALPKVTVYTVNHNYADHVIDAIKSVIGQDFQDWEYHIWDDGSNDDSLHSIVAFVSSLNGKLQNRIRVFANDENIGLPATCNKELKQARGRYILRLDSDDILKNNAIGTMVKSIEEQNCHVLFTAYDEIDDNGKFIKKVYNNPNHPGCCLIKTACAQEIKYRDGLQLGEGKEFFLRLLKLYKSHHIESILWSYRRHQGQKTEVK